MFIAIFEGKNRPYMQNVQQNVTKRVAANLAAKLPNLLLSMKKQSW